MMDTNSLLVRLQERAGAEFIGYGSGDATLPIAAHFDAYEAEYAAIRRRTGIMHLPQRGLVEVTGEDRADFLHRMITNDVNGLAPGNWRRSFFLNAKGRIVADLIVLHDPSRTLLDLDVFNADEVVSTLEPMVFTEDVQFRDLSADYEHLALHGPASVQLLNQITGTDMSGLESGQYRTVPLEDDTAVVYRRDDAGAPGLHLLVTRTAAAAVYQKLLDEAGFDPNAEIDAEFAEKRRQSLRGRPVGWLAYNTARIEAGTAIFHIDFGPDSLPAETGAEPLKEAVSFTKGCYLGQEIVARMQSLGHPKRVLVGIRFEGDKLPIAGAPMHVPAAEGEPDNAGDIVGGITSSTLSPMLGDRPIALAVMKWGRHRPGTAVVAPAEDAMVRGSVCGVGFLSDA